MTHANYFRRFVAQTWTANGTAVRVGTNGRHIADTGPHHTPASEYPAGLAKQDEAHAFRASQAVLAASQQADESLMDEALDALQTAVLETLK
jgi:hypothetical protein